jgi:hypothetical protein
MASRLAVARSLTEPTVAPSTKMPRHVRAEAARAPVDCGAGAIVPSCRRPTNAQTGFLRLPYSGGWLAR